MWRYRRRENVRRFQFYDHPTRKAHTAPTHTHTAVRKMCLCERGERVASVAAMRVLAQFLYTFISFDGILADFLCVCLCVCMRLLDLRPK